jgi:hypothetical protein
MRLLALARGLLAALHPIRTFEVAMRNRDELERVIKEQLLYRGLRPVRGKLAFAHKGAIVELCIDYTLYRGAFIAVQERGRTVREFRAQAGDYDWDALAAAVVDVAEGRAAVGRAGTRGVDAANQKLAADLRAMLGPSASHLTIEPSHATPGRVRVRLKEVALDALAVVQLFAAVSRALPQALPQ